MKKVLYGVAIVFVSALIFMLTACPADGSAKPAPLIPGPGPEEPEDLSTGWLTWPINTTVNMADSFDVYVRIRIPGKTDVSTGNDPVPGLEVSVGYGPVGVDPSLAGWTWIVATPNSAWTDPDSLGANEYKAAVQVNEAGTYLFTPRYRLSAGSPWIYCDTEGRDYNPDRAGQLTVLDPCAGITCDFPPSSYCDGPNVVRYITPGMCDAGMCVYTSETVPCDSGMVCHTGMCVEE